MIYKVRTSIDDEQKARMIASYLVEARAAVSAHIRRAETVYAWDNEIVQDIEWEIECLTTCPSQIRDIVHGMHSYELAEMIETPVKGTDDIERWVLDWCEIQE